MDSQPKGDDYRLHGDVFNEGAVSFSSNGGGDNFHEDQLNRDNDCLGDVDSCGPPPGFGPVYDVLGANVDVDSDGLLSSFGPDCFKKYELLSKNLDDVRNAILKYKSFIY